MSPYKQKQAEFSQENPFAYNPAIYFVPDYSPVITRKKGDSLQTPAGYFDCWIAVAKHSAQRDIELRSDQLHEYTGKGLCSHFSRYRNARKVGECFETAVCFIVFGNVNDYLCKKHKRTYLKSLEATHSHGKKRLEFLECFEAHYRSNLASGFNAEEAAEAAQLEACEQLKIKA